MLIGIPSILGPELLSTLRAMGHGDEIAIVDGNYPALEHGRRLIRADGHGLIPIVDAILQLLPVDDFVRACAVPGDRQRRPRCARSDPSGNARHLREPRTGTQAGAAAGRALLRSRQERAHGRCDQRAEALWQHDHPQGGDLSGQRTARHDHLLRRSADRHAAARKHGRRACIRALCRRRGLQLGDRARPARHSGRSSSPAFPPTCSGSRSATCWHRAMSARATPTFRRARPRSPSCVSSTATPPTLSMTRTPPAGC